MRLDTAPPASAAPLSVCFLHLTCRGNHSFANPSSFRIPQPSLALCTAPPASLSNWPPPFVNLPLCSASTLPLDHSPAACISLHCTAPSHTSNQSTCENTWLCNMPLTVRWATQQGQCGNAAQDRNAWAGTPALQTGHCSPPSQDLLHLGPHLLASVCYRGNK